TGSVVSSGSGCPGANVTITKVIPTVILLVDQSGSMTTTFGSGTRWSTVHDALLDPSSGIVMKLQDDVRFGLSLYTSKSGFAGGTCRMLDQVNVAIGNYAAIKAAFDAAQPIGDTPTGESISAVTNELAAVTTQGPKVIVLATDGEPDTCAYPHASPQA